VYYVDIEKLVSNSSNTLMKLHLNLKKCANVRVHPIVDISISTTVTFTSEVHVCHHISVLYVSVNIP